MKKGNLTKENIITTAFEASSRFGLESLSIGELAKKVGMSKSGLFGHFKSKEKLQIMVLDYASKSFISFVVVPALKEPRGTARIHSFMENWKNWTVHQLPGGCPIASAAIEYDDRPGPIRDHIKALISDMIKTFSRASEIAIEEGQFKKDLNTQQFAYEIYAFMIGYHVFKRLLGEKKADEQFQESVDSLIARSSV